MSNFAYNYRKVNDYISPKKCFYGYNNGNNNTEETPCLIVSSTAPSNAYSA